MIHPANIPISNFTYQLPPEKIATYPLPERHDARLLVYRHHTITDGRFIDLVEYVDPKALLIFNNTRVIRARLLFPNATGRSIEVFCLEPAGSTGMEAGLEARGKVRWTCLVGQLKKWKETRVVLDQNGIRLDATIVDRRATHQVIEFSWTPSGMCFSEVLNHLGAVPIPPYLDRQSEIIDQTRYQTVYAEAAGSVAAPTAGLHFTPRVFKSLTPKEVECLNVTLHVGAGTFMPVKSETMAGHVMHAEWMDIRLDTLKHLLLGLHRQIIPVGTTSLRTVESLYWMGVKIVLQPDIELPDLAVQQWDAYTLVTNGVPAHQALTALIDWMGRNHLGRLICQTSLLIAPPYELKIASGIVTNFHQPQSTLLLLISAIVGEKWREIYNHALDNDYRFLSYGDSSLLFK